MKIKIFLILLFNYSKYFLLLFNRHIIFFSNNTNLFRCEMILNLVCLKYFDSGLFNFIRKEIKYF